MDARERADVPAIHDSASAPKRIPMLHWLAQFLTAPIVGGFIDAYKARLAADNAADRAAADLAAKAIAAEIEARKSADAMLVAEQGRWWTAIIRPLLAAPVVIYLWKVVVWDKVLALGSTDALTGDVAVWAGAIVTTYVGGRSLEKIARTIWRPAPRPGAVEASPARGGPQPAATFSDSGRPR